MDRFETLEARLAKLEAVVSTLAATVSSLSTKLDTTALVADNASWQALQTSEEVGQMKHGVADPLGGPRAGRPRKIPGKRPDARHRSFLFSAVKLLREYAERTGNASSAARFIDTTKTQLAVDLQLPEAQEALGIRPADAVKTFKTLRNTLRAYRPNREHMRLMGWEFKPALGLIVDTI